MTSASAQAKPKAAQIVTPEFRVSFPSVFRSKKVNPNDPNEKAKFSLTMLFRVKADPAKPHEKAVDLTPLKQLALTAATGKWGPDQTKWPTKKVDGVVKSAIRMPFRNGADKDYEGYDGNVVFCYASSTMQPGLVDGQKQPILQESDFYAGCYARATITAFAYDNKGNMGVSFGLRNIQKIRDGEPFSGRTKPENDFDAIEAPAGVEAPAAGNAPGLFDV